ncbi:MAG: trigger factor [Syntrophobacteraceae bacterium]|nr:trigger factor [Syntrophobacteraceae bacterium]
MNVNVVDLSSHQKKLQVQVPPEEVRQELEKKYRQIAKNVRIRGFRPGRVPRSILKSYYGKTVEKEVSSEFIQNTFPQALRDANLQPLIEADVDDMQFAEDGSFTYSAVVDVCPAFRVDGHRGIEIYRPPVQVTQEQLDTEMERLRQQHTQIRTLEVDRPIREGDIVLVDFTPWVDGKIFKKGETRDYMMEVGKNALHPDFDRHLIDRWPGESFSFELDYPEDAPTREIAGKRVQFDIIVRELKEKVLPDLNDEFARETGSFDTLDALREEIRRQIENREEEKSRSEVRKQIVDRLLQSVEFDLSPRVIEREVDHLVRMLRHQFETQGLKIDTGKFDTPEIRASYRPQAVQNVRWRLICEQIARQEGLELTDQEMGEIYAEVARVMRVDVETMRNEYTDSAIVAQAREVKIQDKVFQWIESEAVFLEQPQEAQGPAQE